MKWIMILVILPGHNFAGREIHQPFDTREECITALRYVRLQATSEGWGYCVTQENERWFFNGKPE